MSVNGVKVKSESYFSISPGVMALWRYGGNTLGSPDRVKLYVCIVVSNEHKIWVNCYSDDRR